MDKSQCASIVSTRTGFMDYLFFPERESFISFLIVDSVNNTNTDSNPVLHSIFIMLLSDGIISDAPYSVAKSNMYLNMVLMS